MLPTYPLVQQKLPILFEFGPEDEAQVLGESLIESDEGDCKAFEAVNRIDLSGLQTSHGDLEIGVQFKKKLPAKFYTIVKSPAIRVPQQVIKAKDIQINSSPGGVGSGDWIDMTQHHMYSLKKQQQHSATGQIRILTTAHKPGSSLSDNTASIKKHNSLTDFIKYFERPCDDIGTSSSSMGPSQLIEILEAGRSRKILFDRWLEELEIEHESLMGNGFDLINNME